MSNSNSTSRYFEKHVRVGGNLTAANLYTRNEWKAYTPTVISGGTFATSATMIARWRLQGTNLQIQFSYSDSAATAGVSSGTYLISMPSGIILSADRASMPIGQAIVTEAAGSTTLIGVALASGTTSPGFTMTVGTELVAPVAWGNSAPAGARLSTATAKTARACMEVEIDPTSPILLAITP